MKKLLAVIAILLVIFIGMYFRKIKLIKTAVNITEIKEIEDYIGKIYMWKEVTGDALPKFNNINDAPNIWIWEVVKRNLDNYELSYDDIQEKAIEIFGNDFTKKFPKEGTEYIYYNGENNKYITGGRGLDSKDDMFFIKNISKNKEIYEVEIVEFLEDYENAMVSYNESEEQILEVQEYLIDQEYDIYIENLNEDRIATVKNTESDEKVIEKVKENIEKFSTKKIMLKRNNKNKLNVKSVQ